MQTIADMIGDLNLGVIMSTDEYIEHEVKLRVIEQRFTLIEGKLNWIISLIIGGMLLPVFMRVVNWV